MSEVLLWARPPPLGHPDRRFTSFWQSLLLSKIVLPCSCSYTMVRKAPLGREAGQLMGLPYEFPFSQGSWSLMPVFCCPNKIASYSSPAPFQFCGSLWQEASSGSHFSILEPEMEVLEVFFSSPIGEEDKKQFVIMGEGQQFTFTLWFHTGANSPVLQTRHLIGTVVISIFYRSGWSSMTSHVN